MPCCPFHAAGVDARDVALVVRSCPLVAGLHAGARDRIATVAGPRRVLGVRMDGNSLVLGVIGRDGVSTDDVVTQVRAALARCAPGYLVTVSVRSVSDMGGRPPPVSGAATRSAHSVDR